MASIRKLNSGKWNVQIRRKGNRPISKTFQNKSEAEKWLRKVESEIERDVYVDCSVLKSITLREALERYVAEVTPSKKGAIKERYRIKTWMKHPYADRAISSFKASDFAHYRDARLKMVSAATVRRELGIISHVFNVARKDWSFSGLANPIEDIRKPRLRNARNRRLTFNEKERLIDACKHSSSRHLLPLVLLALETAMRLGEMVSLLWEQVDIDCRTVTLFDTKNGEDRVVPLSNRAVNVLNGLKASTGKNRRVFYTWSRPDSVKTAWNTALRLARIEDFHFHDLRHEATSTLFEIGLNPMEVASITGHKSMQMLRRYTHPRISDLVRKLGVSDDGEEEFKYSG